MAPIHVQKINHRATFVCWLSTAGRTFSIISSLIVNYVLLNSDDRRVWLTFLIYMLDYHAGAGRPVQGRHTRLCSYRRNLKNVWLHYIFIVVSAVSVKTRIMRMYVCMYVRKFPNVQNSPPLLRPCGARQVLVSSNAYDELRHENRIALSCLVIVLCFFM